MTLMDKENNIKPRLFACTCGYYPAGTLLPLRGAWQKRDIKGRALNTLKQFLAKGDLKCPRILRRYLVNQLV